jgi:glutamate 5-kinase
MYERIVIKLGTSVLTGGTPNLDWPHMVDLVRQCAALHKQGKDVILCSSGAIAAGKQRLASPDLPPTLASKQLFAAVDQSWLMWNWERFFEIYGIHVGQMLLTRSDTENRRRFLNASDTLQALLDYRVIPIVNENDAVATEEIRLGDNDNLSALVAVLADADLLILLTDQPGLFTADPRSHPDAELIPEVHHIDATLRALAGGTSTTLGTGGMDTKLQAADAARRAGCDVVIAAGAAPDVILRVVAGEQVGTRFPALETPLEHRKRWIFAGPKPPGSVVIDDGAVAALTEDGRSLLPAGIIQVNGPFERGDAISIHDGRHKELARGIVRYASRDLQQLQGCHSRDIETRLGYTYGAVAVHRNDLILV